MLFKNRLTRATLSFALSVLAVTGCATTPRPSPPDGVTPAKLAPLSSKELAIAPPPSGTYSQRLTALRERWSTQLNATPTKPAP